MPGIKYDEEKPRLALLSTYALTETAKVLNYGAEKYGDDNWREGISARRLISAALRHILAYNDGEDNDLETGLSHLAHAMCMIMFELESHVTHPELDDRHSFHPAPPVYRGPSCADTRVTGPGLFPARVFPVD